MTQNQKLLRDLQRGQTLTPLIALERHGCFRLAARILELRREGWTILSRKAKIGRKYVSSYRLAA